MCLWILSFPEVEHWTGFHLTHIDMWLEVLSGLGFSISNDVIIPFFGSFFVSSGLSSFFIFTLTEVLLIILSAIRWKFFLSLRTLSRHAFWNSRETIALMMMPVVFVVHHFHQLQTNIFLQSSLHSTRMSIPLSGIPSINCCFHGLCHNLHFTALTCCLGQSSIWRLNAKVRDCSIVIHCARAHHNPSFDSDSESVSWEKPWCCNHQAYKNGFIYSLPPCYSLLCNWSGDKRPGSKNSNFISLAICHLVFNYSNSNHCTMVERLGMKSVWVSFAKSLYFLSFGSSWATRLCISS